METQQAADSRQPRPSDGGQFVWSKLALWLIAAPVVGLAAAWIAQIGQTYFAPWLIFPLLVGTALGAVLVGLMRVAQIAHRPTVLLGTLLAVTVAVAGQHYIGYLAAYHGPSPAVKRLMPFGEFLCQQADGGRPILGNVARGGLVWLTWVVDGLLVLAAALAMVISALRQPYCNRCRSWYRTIRAGRVDVATARQMAQAAGLATVEQPKRARFRLACCQGGCGQTRFELSWEGVEGEILTLRAWLDNTLRNRINEILDQAAAEEQ